jgi:type II secretory pathway pseudopilin PulG
MVMMMIGMLASMAIPRIATAAPAAGTAVLSGDLAVVRKAINIYMAEHGNRLPGPTEARFIEQMTQYSDAAGSTSPTPSPAFPFGPYLVRIPAAPVGQNTGDAGVHIDAVNSPPLAKPSTGKGWVYNPATGEFFANTSNGPQVGVTLTNGDAVAEVSAKFGGSAATSVSAAVVEPN